MAISCEVFHNILEWKRMLYIVEAIYEIESLEAFQISVCLRISQ